MSAEKQLIMFVFKDPCFTEQQLCFSGRYYCNSFVSVQLEQNITVFFFLF